MDLPNGLISSFVTLIPKIDHSIRITDFCPIVMGNFIYKIFTKIIATHLRKFIGEILSSNQFGFIPGRRIHTYIALASEVINNLNLGRHGQMALKVDITKAFDMVSLDFLYQVLQKMNFSDSYMMMV